jgi:hypothetical protein
LESPCTVPNFEPPDVIQRCNARRLSQKFTKSTEQFDQLMHIYEVRPRKDKRGVDLISAVLPFDRLWYGKPNAVSNAVGYAKFRSRSHDAVIRVYDEAGNVIETHEHKGEFREP